MIDWDKKTIAVFDKDTHEECDTAAINDTIYQAEILGLNVLFANKTYVIDGPIVFSEVRAITNE